MSRLYEKHCATLARMTDIKALFFDIGGVLIRTEDLEPRRKWEKRFGLHDWQLQDLFFNSEVGQAAQVGQASAEDAWALVASTLGVSAEDLPYMQADFYRGDMLDRSLITLIQSLRPRYKTGVISNAMPDARESLKDRINGDTFDVLVFSGEEGVRKPDAEIYRRALTRLGVQPAQAVFVDDVLANVEAARALGMHGIHFTLGVDVRTELNKLGIVTS
jgi:epoxide hydrolase-like predicted phosphatase